MILSVIIHPKQSRTRTYGTRSVRCPAIRCVKASMVSLNYYWPSRAWRPNAINIQLKLLQNTVVDGHASSTCPQHCSKIPGGPGLRAHRPAKASLRP